MSKATELNNIIKAAGNIRAGYGELIRAIDRSATYRAMSAAKLHAEIESKAPGAIGLATVRQIKTTCNMLADAGIDPQVITSFGLGQVHVTRMASTSQTALVLARDLAKGKTSEDQAKAKADAANASANAKRKAPAKGRKASAKTPAKSAPVSFADAVRAIQAVIVAKDATPEQIETLAKLGQAIARRVVAERKATAKANA